MLLEPCLDVLEERRRNLGVVRISPGKPLAWDAQMTRHRRRRHTSNTSRRNQRERCFGDTIMIHARAAVRRRPVLPA